MLKEKKTTAKQEYYIGQNCHSKMKEKLKRCLMHKSRGSSSPLDKPCKKMLKHVLPVEREGC